MKNPIKLIIPCLALLFLFFSCSQPQPQGAGYGGIQEYPVYTLKTDTATLNAAYPASLEGEQNIEIRPKVDGYLQQIYVDEGSVVKKGQILFKISAPQYEQAATTAAAAIASAEAEVGTARLQLANIKPLVDKEIVTPTALEAAQYSLQSKEALLNQAKVSLANAKTNIGYTTILSPVDGVVGNIPNKTGSLVGPSAPLPITTVSNISKIYAYFSFDEKQFLEFISKYPGKTIAEKLKSMPAVNLVLPDGSVYPQKGRIETVNGIIDKQTGAANFRATFPNPSGTIRSGGSATLQIPLVISSALLLPQKATFEMQGKKMVFVVDSKGMVKGREVEVMDLATPDNYVVESGLKPGDQIVTDGMGNLKDSVIIKPVPMKVTGQH